MTPALWLLVGLALGGAAVWWLQHAELTTLRHDKREAEDRLFYAYREEKAIPAPRAIEITPIEPLPKELQDEVDQFESPEGRAAMEAKIRSLHDRGLKPIAILRELEQPKH